MKKLLFILLLSPCASFAQKIEFGIGGGISVNTKASDNMPFKTDKMAVNYATNLNVLYNISNHLQAGVEVHLLGLSGKSSQSYTDYFGHQFAGDDKRIVYARRAFSFCAVLNGRKTIGRGYGFAGLAAGYGAARHDSKTLSGNEAYRAPNGGNGLVLGLQAGYIAGVTKRLAVSAELAMRYYSFKYDAAQPLGTGEDLKYSIIAFPLTVGLRYQLFTGETREKENQDLMNQGGSVQ